MQDLMTPLELLFIEFSTPLYLMNRNMEISKISLNSHGCFNLTILAVPEKLTINIFGKEPKTTYPPFPSMVMIKALSLTWEIGSLTNQECLLILNNSLSGSDTKKSSDG